MLQVNPQALPLHVAFPLAGTVHGLLHDDMPHVRGLLFCTHCPVQMC